MSAKRWQISASVLGAGDITNIVIAEANSILDLANLATAIDALPAVQDISIERRTPKAGLLERSELAELVIAATGLRAPDPT